MPQCAYVYFFMCKAQYFYRFFFYFPSSYTFPCSRWREYCDGWEIASLEVSVMSREATKIIGKMNANSRCQQSSHKPTILGRSIQFSVKIKENGDNMFPNVLLDRKIHPRKDLRSILRDIPSTNSVSRVCKCSIMRIIQKVRFPHVISPIFRSLHVSTNVQLCLKLIQISFVR